MLLQNGAKEEEAAEPVEEPGKNDDFVLATAVADNATAEEMKADAPAPKEDAQPAQPAPVPTEPAAAVDDGTETLKQADQKEQEESKAQQTAEPLPAPAVAAEGAEAALMEAPAAPKPAALPVPKVAARAAEKAQEAGHENGAALLEESPRCLLPFTHASVLAHALHASCSCLDARILLRLYSSYSDALLRKLFIFLGA